MAGYDDFVNMAGLASTVMIHHDQQKIGGQHRATSAGHEPASEFTTKSNVVRTTTPKGKTAMQFIRSNTWLYAFIRFVILFAICGVVYIILLHLVQPAILKDVDKVGPDTVRERTIIVAAISITNAVIVTIAVIAGLGIMGVQASALITAAGVVSVVIGLAAQSILKDFLNGLLLLGEDQYNIGNRVTIGLGSSNMNGTIVQIGIRNTTLRNDDGSIVYIPNGLINTVTNFSQASQRINVSVRIAYVHSVDNAMTRLRQAAENIKNHRHIGPFIISGPDVVGVTSLGETFYEISMRAEILPAFASFAERTMRTEIVRVLWAYNIPTQFQNLYSVNYTSDVGMYTDSRSLEQLNSFSDNTA